MQRSILYAGGGTGGHIFPNLAIQEQAQEMGIAAEPHFAVSMRPLDAQIISAHGWGYTPVPVEPLPRGIGGLARWPGFAKSWRRSVRVARDLIRRHQPIAVVATGGFVCGPVVVAARRARVPVALVNLDAVAGLANRTLARRSTTVFTVYDAALPGRRIGLPLRRTAVGPGEPGEARQRLGLDPRAPTLLVLGGSQGARTVNEMMLQLLRDNAARPPFQGWQVLHLLGTGTRWEPYTQAYRQAAVDAKVEPFLDQIGLGWSAASLAISRAGAGSVAEAWANATPTIFMPYPHHRDQHQRFNAQPLIELKAAALFEDLIDPRVNAQKIRDLLLGLIENDETRSEMTRRLQRSWPGNGARDVARWLGGRL